MEKVKVKGVLDWPTSKRVKDIQKFLGLINYYQQFIKDFVFIARLLYDLMKKNQKQNWTEKQERVFGELKKRFTKELVLVVLDLDKKMRMKVDILDYIIEEVLFMKYKDRQQRLIAFLSKSLNETERNYKIHDKKMLAVIRELENWRYFKYCQRVQNINLKFELITKIQNIL